MAGDTAYMKREFEFIDKTHVVTCETFIDMCPMLEYFNTMGVKNKMTKNHIKHRIYDVDLRVNADNMWRIVSDAALCLCDGCKFKQKER